MGVRVGLSKTVHADTMGLPVAGFTYATRCGRGRAGDVLNPTGDPVTCRVCLKILAKVLSVPERFVVQGRRGGSWVNVPDAAFDVRIAAIDRADVLGSSVGDSEFRVLDLASGSVVYQRLAAGLDVGCGLMIGSADYAAEPKRYRRRVKGTRRQRSRGRGGWTL